ncbi:pimeloyl-ACP methyl ester carboxylesterase [Acinetobacter calcoaceticus]|uniref:Pimeloyl-ACP methyl ester carboxylesterase n=1 Tax=Acinetobacter calcoaceticus TaxID=471 RepID=A0A4R1XVY0_ACICA|nr:pimeloyl-ACP methyl ester carboxylesterase [Acinetobacter calcoaceticus]
MMTNISKPLIHFAHANGVPSKVYQRLFDQLSDEYQVVYVPMIGPDKRYPISNHWPHLVDQVIDSIVQQAKGQPVIGLGHSLGSVLTLMASYKRPELFSQVIMLDPPLILGKNAFAFHLAKLFHLKTVDKITPAGLSVRRRDHWDSREQAGELLRPKGFYKSFDAACFQHYLDHALTEDKVRGGVTLSIPKDDEVEIFRTNPSLWWLPMPKPKVPVHLVVGDQSPFYIKKFPHSAKRKLGIPFTVTPGGHMFPLEHPSVVVDLIKDLIKPSP